MRSRGLQSPAKSPCSLEEARVRALTASLLRGTLQIKKECLACRGAAAVFNMSYFGKFYLVGLDARKAADWLFSADVNRPPGMTSKGPCSFPTPVPGRAPRTELWAPMLAEPVPSGLL